MFFAPSIESRCYSQTEMVITINQSCFNCSVSKVSVNLDQIRRDIEYAAIFLALFGFICNLSILIMFGRHKNLRTPFTIYLIFLLSFNLILTVTRRPLKMFKIFYDIWPLGKFMCTVYNYTNWTITGCVMNSHALITINRIWALGFPLSYRNYHSWKLATVLCLCMVLFVHLLTLPLIISDTINFRQVARLKQCDFNQSAQQGLVDAVNVVIYLFPVLIIVGAYPFLWVKSRRRQAMRTVQPPIQPSMVSPNNGDTHFDSGVAVLEPRKKNLRAKSSQTSFLVLTAMTTSTLLCWAPATIKDFLQEHAGMGKSVLSTVVPVLIDLEVALDPILFALTMKDLRAVIMGGFCCGKKEPL